MGAVVIVCAACGGAAAPAKNTVSNGLRPISKELRIERGIAKGGAAPSPVLAAMKAEISRAMDGFKAKRETAPYFLSYAVADERSVSISATLGAAYETQDSRERSLDIDLRVGDSKRDNTHPIRGEDFMERWASRDVRSANAPLEDDLDALRVELWQQTDRRHRKAVEELAKVRAQAKTKVKEEDQSDDFSTESAVTYVDPPASMEIDIARWQKLTREWSALFKSHPEIHTSRVSFSAHYATRWFVSSEGTMVQTPWTNVRLAITAQTKADDGMVLDRFESFDVSSPSAIPDDATVRRKIQLVIDDLTALRAAPVAEPWSGPAILEGRAAGVFFHEVFGHRIEGHRQKNEEEGQTFARKVGRLIMPEFIRVYDDPLLRRVEGTEVNGHYLFDDEGVPAQRAELVDHGVLKTFLLSRSPVRGFARSNGHGRRQEGMAVVARQGNLVVDPTVRVSTAELKKRLIAEVQRQHAPYGLRFRDIQGGYTNTSRGGPQSFKVLPVIVFRVYPDGREELVRGVDLEGTPLTSLSRILAAGDDFDVFNGHCGAESGWVPVAAASPSLLIEDIETARREKDQDTPPILPPPPTSTGGAR